MRVLTLVVTFLAVAGCGSSANLPRPAPPKGKPALLVEMRDNQPLALAGSVFWDGTAKPASIQYIGKSQFKPTLTLRFASPNGFGLFAEYGNGGTLIPVNLPEGCDDGGGDLKSGCYGQLGLANFDTDGNPDVVVAFGDGNMNLHVNVIRYHPPGSASDVSRAENWELIGSFEGQSQARIDHTKIELPIGSNGAGNTFVFVDNKFLDSNGTAAVAPAQPAQHEAQQRTKTLTGHYRADGLYVYDRTDAAGTAPVLHSQSQDPQCSQLLGMLDTASSNARRVIMQNLNVRGCSIPQDAVQHVAHPAYDACVAVLQQAGATDTSHCDHLYNR